MICCQSDELNQLSLQTRINQMTFGMRARESTGVIFFEERQRFLPQMVQCGIRKKIWLRSILKNLASIMVGVRGNVILVSQGEKLLRELFCLIKRLRALRRWFEHL